MENIVIDDSFISKWHPKYDELENDEKEYCDLIVKVSEELSKGDTLSKDVFISILNWKSPRVKGKIRDDFEHYSKGIKQAINAPENQKIEILDDLYGIGIPVASTVLHIIYPKIFPIVDFRTVEVLKRAGYFNKSMYFYRNTLNGYDIFRAKIKDIANQNPNWNLRQIDRALFAYHKTNAHLFERESSC